MKAEGEDLYITFEKGLYVGTFTDEAAAERLNEARRKAKGVEPVTVKYVPALKLDELKRLAPLCDEHGSGTGARSGCPYCALISMGAALGEIDYLCGEPNEMHVSGYDVHQNERAVLDHVRSRLDSLSSRLGALRECVDEWQLDMHPDAISALRAILDDGPEPVVERRVTCECPHEGICEHGPDDPRCGRNWDAAIVGFEDHAASLCCPHGKRIDLGALCFECNPCE